MDRKFCGILNLWSTKLDFSFYGWKLLIQVKDHWMLTTGVESGSGIQDVQLYWTDVHGIKKRDRSLLIHQNLCPYIGKVLNINDPNPLTF